MSKNLLNEAIADAKAVKETAYANARLALQEALAPHIQSMISATLAEDLDGNVANEVFDSVNEDNTEYGTDDMHKVKDITEKAESDEDKKKDEAMKPHDEDKKKDEAVKADDEDKKKNEAKEDKEDMDENDDMSDLDLEAIIRELEEELASSEIGQGDNREPSNVASAADTEDPGKHDLIKSESSHSDEDGAEKHEGTRMIDLEELIRALREVDAEDDEEMHKEEYSDDEEKKKMETLESDLAEAYEVITFLKSQINEVNLLNAKLLYSTKLFKKFELNESQKAKVIENLDRTKNVREAKLIYTTLAETFQANKLKKSSLKESFASDAIPSTKPSSKTTEIISGGDEVANRFKILAGLKK